MAYFSNYIHRAFNRAHDHHHHVNHGHNHGFSSLYNPGNRDYWRQQAAYASWNQNYGGYNPGSYVTPYPSPYVAPYSPSAATAYNLYSSNNSAYSSYGGYNASNYSSYSSPYSGYNPYSYELSRIHDEKKTGVGWKWPTLAGVGALVAILATRGMKHGAKQPKHMDDSNSPASPTT